MYEILILNDLIRPKLNERRLMKMIFDFFCYQQFFKENCSEWTFFNVKLYGLSLDSVVDLHDDKSVREIILLLFIYNDDENVVIFDYFQYKTYKQFDNTII